MVRRALRRSQVLAWFAKLAPCLIGMEACATAHYWARELRKFGHEVRLIPPAYAKAYVRRNKNDAADAAAICEAVSRPSMRFVAIKTEAQQAVGGIHKVRALLLKQRTMLINHLRGLMAEFGIVVATGPRHVGELLAILADPEEQGVPEPAARVRCWRMTESLARPRAADRGDRPADRRLGSQQHDLPPPDHHSRLWTDPGQRHGRDRDRSRQPSAAGGTSPPRSAWCPGRRGPAAR